MIRARLSQCRNWVAGSTMTADVAFEGVATDSRTAPPGSLFIALRGENFDAHAFLTDVAARGVAAIVADASCAPQHLANLTVPLLLVPDTRRALGEIALGWRRQFAVPMIGVTGSNGKTTVKEMIAAILVAGVGAAHAMATRGNFNNDIGLPLTLLRLDAGIHAAVVEIGMNHPGEIAQLAALAQPTVALVNNAQREHQEFMATVEAVAQENGAVFASLPDDGTAVFPADDAYTPLWRALALARGPRRLLGFGLSADADVRCTYVANTFGSDMAVTAGVDTFTVRLAAAGEHNVRNALAAIACTRAIGMPVEAIVRGLEAFAPVAGRLQRKQRANGAQVIDDTYNANPDSVRAAIDVLAQASAPRVLVLGDMGEVGDDGATFHEEIGAHARARGIDHLLTFGVLALASTQAFGRQATHFNDIDALQAAAVALATPPATVLVKGSRFMQMERVVNHLIGPLPGQPIQDSH